MDMIHLEVIGLQVNMQILQHTALTHLVEALFPYCDEVTVNDKVVYSKYKKIVFKESEHSISSSKSKSSDIIDFESIVQTPRIKLTFI